MQKMKQKFGIAACLAVMCFAAQAQLASQSNNIGAMPSVETNATISTGTGFGKANSYAINATKSTPNGDELGLTPNPAASPTSTVFNLTTNDIDSGAKAGTGDKKQQPSSSEQCTAAKNIGSVPSVNNDASINTGTGFGKAKSYAMHATDSPPNGDELDVTPKPTASQMSPVVDVTTSDSGTQAGQSGASKQPNSSEHVYIGIETSMAIGFSKGGGTGDDNDGAVSHEQSYLLTTHTSTTGNEQGQQSQQNAVNSTQLAGLQNAKPDDTGSQQHRRTAAS